MSVMQRILVEQPAPINRLVLHRHQERDVLLKVMVWPSGETEAICEFCDAVFVFPGQEEVHAT